MKYVHIGWCREGNSDKVWGAICLREPERSYSDGKYVTFWGRRGAKLQTKIVEDKNSWQLQQMFQKKLDKGYKAIMVSKLNEVYPEFKQDLEKTAVWAALRAGA